MNAHNPMTHTIASLQDKSLEELTRMLAELLGKCTHGHEHWEHEGPEGDRELVCTICKDSLRNLRIPAYATSYDAIMPEVKNLQGWKRHDFLRIVGNLAGCEEDSYANEFNRLTASPVDLTRALILTKQTNEETK